MGVPKDLRYTKQHEWIRVEGPAGTIGITDFAQEALGDITFVELPQVGRELAQGDEVSAIESCKAAASIYAPVAGKVAEANAALDADPSLVNSDPYNAGWVCKVELADPAEVESLMDADAYEKFLAEQVTH